MRNRIYSTRAWLNQPFYFTRGVALVLPIIVGCIIGALVYGGLVLFQQAEDSRNALALAQKLNTQNDKERAKILARLSGLEHPTTQDLREYFRRLLLALRGQLEGERPRRGTEADKLRRTLLRVIEELGFRLTGEPPRGSGRTTRPDAGLPAPSPQGGDRTGPPAGPPAGPPPG